MSDTTPATITLHHGDCLEVMRAMPADSVDAIVTDPPYGLGFMGKAWDALPPGEEWAAECLRVLKPGGHLLAFGGTRTWHRLAVAVEDAGFEMRDSLAWLYGSGFPKSMDVSKAIDKAAGAAREVIGTQPDRWTGKGGVLNFSTDRAQSEINVTGGPATPAAEQWAGWGTALKPAFEPIVMARKPLIGTVAANVQAHGTGALNIDASRIEGGARPLREVAEFDPSIELDGVALKDRLYGSRGTTKAIGETTAGRWPANVILDESMASVLDEQSGTTKSTTHRRGKQITGQHGGLAGAAPKHGEGVAASVRGVSDAGGASRFFYVAKAPKRERPVVDGVAHATVKPLAVMRWLVRMVTPPGGVVLDPFGGSGTTAEAAHLEGFDSIIIEREAEYLPLIEFRADRVGVQLAGA